MNRINASRARVQQLMIYPGYARINESEPYFPRHMFSIGSGVIDARFWDTSKGQSVHWSRQLRFAGILTGTVGLKFKKYRQGRYASSSGRFIKIAGNINIKVSVTPKRCQNP